MFYLFEQLFDVSQVNVKRVDFINQFGGEIVFIIPGRTYAHLHILKLLNFDHPALQKKQ